ncbi:MAG TPA: ABC transporter transmembrane domain-containing protein [Stellaceae bacterium]|nr:ABC transporter transmembrane domain-containing protein [Stellaceae bacterium]
MKRETDLQQALRACRGAGLFLIAFSAGINLLALASPLYMMQLYDRVLSSRSIDTLTMLTVAFTTALVALSVLEGLRSLVLGRVGVWLDDRLGPPVIAAGLRAALSGAGPGPAGEAMRDLATVKNFLSGPSTTPLMDMPWAPLFLILLFILHPLLGMIGLLSTLLLFGLAVLNEYATKHPLQRANTATAKSMRALDSAFRNAEVIEAMGMHDGVLKLWRRSVQSGTEAQRIAGNRAVVVQGVSKFARLFVQSVIMGAGAWLVIVDGTSAASCSVRPSSSAARWRRSTMRSRHGARWFRPASPIAACKICWKRCRRPPRAWRCRVRKGAFWSSVSFMCRRAGKRRSCAASPFRFNRAKCSG